MMSRPQNLLKIHMSTLTLAEAVVVAPLIDFKISIILPQHIHIYLHLFSSKI